MEKMNLFFLFIIIFYLTYSFIKSKNKKVNKNNKIEKKIDKKDEKIFEKVAITAVLSSIMGEKQFILKRFFLIGNVDEKKSVWRISGRNESMIKRLFFNK